jgi:hypothetical protein
LLWVGGKYVGGKSGEWAVVGGVCVQVESGMGDECEVSMVTSSL